jgi:hypothetical protein
MGAMTNDERLASIKASTLYGHYEKTVDRESAYEKLRGGVENADKEIQPAVKGTLPSDAAKSEGGIMDSLGSSLGNIIFGRTGPRGGHTEGLVEAAAKSAARSLGTSIIRGVLGSVLGGRTRR